ncbi:MAG: hypothetical protein ACKPHM_00765 [Dolichospermum sp.]
MEILIDGLGERRRICILVVVSGLLSVVSGLLLVVSGQWSVVSC